MKTRTKTLTSQVQHALLALDASTLMAILDAALQDSFDFYEDPDLADFFRFRLGWTLEDDDGQSYPEWPDDLDKDFDWVAPHPNTVKDHLATLNTETFYHEILPVFSSWPPLSYDPPSCISDGYQWMQELAAWLAHPRLTRDDSQHTPRRDLSPRLTTTDVAQGGPIPLGYCGDAWKLTAMHDPSDVIDHRPYTDQGRTPVGLCTDAPILVLYPERGSVDWPQLLAPTPLRTGSLFSGASIWVIYLTENDYDYYHQQSMITLDEITYLLAQDPLGFSSATAYFPSRPS